MVRRRYALTPQELGRAQRYAFWFVFGPDGSYTSFAWNPRRNTNIYGLRIKLRVLWVIESELRPLDPATARVRRRDTLLLLRTMQRDMPLWRAFGKP